MNLKIAIYARKSRLSEKGESIHNQIDACKNYILNWSNVNPNNLEFVIYQDEGFSGGNTDRPEFQKMLDAAKQGSFEKLICYRLDRVSRSVADFSTTYELLQAHNIEFVSVKEQFDTSTPIGRAMLNIAMVFAQLERETIAERIRDNMRALAKTGRWLGGKTPTGFSSKQIVYAGDVNTKKMYQLEPIPEEIKLIKLIFDKFIEIQSLRGVETFFMINDITAPSGCRYTAATLKDILTNPVYVIADQNIYHYFNSLESEICSPIEDFNGDYGLMVYNRTDQSNHTLINNEPSKWIVALGKHQGIISSQTWIHVQTLLKSNTSKSFYNKESMSYGLLASLIKCKHCGATMKIKKGKLTASGEQAFVYVCSTKDISRRTKCNVKNIIGQDADQDILEYLLRLSQDDSYLNKMLDSNTLTLKTDISSTTAKINDLETQIEENKVQISNLMSQMAKLSADSTLIPIYLQQLKELDATKQMLQSELSDAQAIIDNNTTHNVNIQIIKDALKKLAALNTTLSMQAKRALVRSVIEKIEWDGENLNVILFGKKN